MSLVIATNVAEAYLLRKDYAQALSKFNAILEIDSTFGIALDRVGKTYRRQGMFEKAVLYYQRAVISSNRSAQFLADLANCLGRLEKRDEANEILKELMGRYEHHATAAFNIAIVYAGLGKTNDALDWLERDCADHSGWMIYLPMEDAFDGIRAEPRFHGILKKIGLEKE
jgi:tetratricopeptide (TPR) repeat protein